MTDTRKKLQDMISTIMELDNDIQAEDKLTDDIGMASIDFVELSVAIEKNLGVAVPQDFLLKGLNFEELVQYVESSVTVS